MDTRLTHVRRVPSLAHTGDADARYSCSAIAFAAAQGLLVDGVKLHAFLLDLSDLLEEAIAREDPQPTTAPGIRPDTMPGGAHHVPFHQASPVTQYHRWNRVVRFFGRARRSVGDTDMSAILGSGIAASLNRKGHGADPRRRLARDTAVFLSTLLSDDGAREHLKRAIATHERPTDFVSQCFQSGRRAARARAQIHGPRHHG